MLQKVTPSGAPMFETTYPDFAGNVFDGDGKICSSKQSEATAEFPPTRFTNNLQGGAPKIAKLVNITSITMVYCIYNYGYWGL